MAPKSKGIQLRTNSHLTQENFSRWSRAVHPGRASCAGKHFEWVSDNRRILKLADSNASVKKYELSLDEINFLNYQELARFETISVREDAHNMLQNYFTMVAILENKLIGIRAKIRRGELSELVGKDEKVVAAGKRSSDADLRKSASEIEQDLVNISKILQTLEQYKLKISQNKILLSKEIDYLLQVHREHAFLTENIFTIFNNHRDLAIQKSELALKTSNKLPDDLLQALAPYSQSDPGVKLLIARSEGAKSKPNTAVADTAAAKLLQSLGAHLQSGLVLTTELYNHVQGMTSSPIHGAQASAIVSAHNVKVAEVMGQAQAAILSRQLITGDKVLENLGYINTFKSRALLQQHEVLGKSITTFDSLIHQLQNKLSKSQRNDLLRQLEDVSREVDDARKKLVREEKLYAIEFETIRSAVATLGTNQLLNIDEIHALKKLYSQKAIADVSNVIKLHLTTAQKQIDNGTFLAKPGELSVYLLALSSEDLEIQDQEQG